MKYFTKLVFGKTNLPKEAFIFAGSFYPKSEFKKIFGLFDSVEKLSDFPPALFYEAKRKNKRYLLCFGAYGGSNTLEIVNLLSGGKVKNIYFFGWAGTYKMIDVGMINIPKKVRALDGICGLDKKNLKFSQPSKELLYSIKINDSFSGTHCTIPALGVLHGIKKIDTEAKDYDSIDIELSVVLHFAKKEKMNAIGVLIITDSPKNHKEIINPDANFNNKTRYEILMKALLEFFNSKK